MITYLVKMVLCSGLFILFYFLLLEKEKMHQFNRFYLLFAIIFSFFIPLINNGSGTLGQPFSSGIIILEEQYSIMTVSNTSIKQSILFPWRIITIGLYIGITLLLFVRYIKNLLTIFLRIRTNELLSFGNLKLVLLNEKIIPHSFSSYIFLNKEEYNNGQVEGEILLHEQAHIQQMHSIDILFIELLMVGIWFNPFIYIYRNAICLNHEFIADNQVVKNIINPHAYQTLLLRKLSGGVRNIFSNPFNYSVTKKRLNMMYKKSSYAKMVLKTSLLFPLIVIAILIFGKNLMAQNTAKMDNPINPIQKSPDETFWRSRTIGYTEKGLSEEGLKEYATIINKCKMLPYQGETGFTHNITDQDRERLISLFRQMNMQQQIAQELYFDIAIPPLPKSTPSKEQFEAFKQGGVYVVLVDEHKIENTELSKYANTDFDQYYISKLNGAAKKNRPYKYQVDLMTIAYYAKYNKEELDKREKGMVFMGVRKLK